MIDILAAINLLIEPSFQRHALLPGWFGAGAQPGRPLRVGVPTVPGCDAALGFDAAFDEAVAQLRTWGIAPQAVDMTRMARTND